MSTKVMIILAAELPHPLYTYIKELTSKFTAISFTIIVCSNLGRTNVVKYTV